MGVGYCVSFNLRSFPSNLFLVIIPSVVTTTASYTRESTFNLKPQSEMINPRNALRLLLLASLGFLSSTPLPAQQKKLIASCCSKNEGRCTGSASCTVCRNCSRCAHCSSGGSCGVCSGGYSRTPDRTYSNSSSTYKSSYSGNGSNSSRSSSNSYKSTGSNSSTKSLTYALPNDILSENYQKTLLVNTETLNVRSGPGTSYTVVEKLKYRQELTFLAMTGSWIKVEVKSTEMVGFVYYEHVRIIK